VLATSETPGIHFITMEGEVRMFSSFREAEEQTRLLGTIAFCFLATKDTTKSKYTFSFEKCCPKRIRKPDDWCIETR
jgi:hypothetical protein